LRQKVLVLSYDTDINVTLGCALKGMKSFQVLALSLVSILLALFHSTKITAVS